VSAFVVGEDHIHYLVQAARHYAVADRTNSYYHDGQAIQFDDWTGLGRMLLQECINSVQYRYSDSPPFNLPGPIPTPIADNYVYRPIRVPVEPAQVFSAAACYEYQSCEHPEWEGSQAHSFLRWLTRTAQQHVAGYENAMWEVTEEQYLEKVAELRAEIAGRFR
jgi:hypothetical protein